MHVSSLIKAALTGLKLNSHEAVLNAMTEALVKNSALESAYKTFCDLRDHESMEGALKDTQCAVFHCLSETIENTVMAVGVSQKGISDPSRRRKVRIYFLIVSPAAQSGTHLRTLSRLEALMHDRVLQHDLIAAKDSVAVVRAIEKSEGSARSFFVPLERGEVYAALETTEAGLAAPEAARRLALVGPNTIRRVVHGVLLKNFLNNLFVNLLAVLLWAGALMGYIAGMPELSVAIVLVIIINAVFSFWQEYKAEAAIEALGRLLPKKVKAMRDAQVQEIDASQVVYGDILCIGEGDSVPADGRLVEADDVRVDNSALTGESRPVYKLAEPVADGTSFIWTEIPNLVFAGTTVLSGTGRLVVTATGMNSEIGRVAMLTQAIKPELSPLQKEIIRITKTVTAIALSLGVVFFILGYLVAGLKFSHSFIFAIGIIVANVPEGLLPIVSLSLAMGAQRMARKNAIVKRLSSIETLGSATYICTDKTGTLTQNLMCVTKMFVNKRLIEVSGLGYEPRGGFFSDNRPLGPKELNTGGVIATLVGAALCNNAKLRGNASGWSITGDPTEGALLTAFEKSGMTTEETLAKMPRVAHLAFERIRKRMSTVHAVSSGVLDDIMPGFVSLETGRVLFLKGAPKEVSELCTKAYLDGKIEPLSDSFRQEIITQNDLMASRGLRVLAVAAREIEVAEKDAYRVDTAEKDLVFLGLIAMLDPPRPEVKGAIAQCRSAGIRVVMITGDYGLTAKAVAHEIGLGENTEVITGADLATMTNAQISSALVEKEVIFARVEPKDKLRVVSILQSRGEIVAVTGDGVNDAPALKKADIGIAMGMRGADAAKESAEMILTDDNFATIVNAIREGRAVYANIKKFVTYIFASNIPEIIPFIAYVIFKIPLPLTVMQILAVDLGTDVMPSLGLGVEPPEAGVMLEKPRPRGKRLLDAGLLVRSYLLLGMLEAALCLAGFFFVYWMRGWRPGTALPESGPVYVAATTMSFAGIVATQIGNVFACRTETQSVFSVGFFKNRFVMASILVEVAIMFMLIYIPPLKRIFGFGPLGGKELAFLLLFPVIMIIAAELGKFVLRQRIKKRG